MTTRTQEWIMIHTTERVEEYLKEVLGAEYVDYNHIELTDDIVKVKVKGEIIEISTDLLHHPDEHLPEFFYREKIRRAKKVKE